MGIPLKTIANTKRLYRSDAAVAKAPIERRTLNVEANQVRRGARRGPGPRPRLLHEEARVEDLHRPVDGRLALDRAAGAGRRDASRPVQAGGLAARARTGRRLRCRQREINVRGAQGQRRRVHAAAEEGALGRARDLQGQKIACSPQGSFFGGCVNSTPLALSSSYVDFTLSATKTTAGTGPGCKSACLNRTRSVSAPGTCSSIHREAPMDWSVKIFNPSFFV